MPYNRRKENGSFASIENWLISIGEHRGIISSSTWIECQDICKEIKNKSSNRQCTSQNALLSGLVICAHCGSSMAPRKQKNKLADGSESMYRYYTCNLKNKAGNRCDNVSLNAYEAEDYVVRKIKSMTYDDILSLYLSSKEKTTIKINNNNSISQLKKQIDDNKISISKLIRKIVKLDDENEIENALINNYESEIKDINNENKILENKILELQEENENISDLKKDISQIVELYDNFKKFYACTENFEDKKRLIASVVKFVVWDSDNNSLQVVPIGSALERNDFGNSAFRSTDQKKWHM